MFSVLKRIFIIILLLSYCSANAAEYAEISASAKRAMSDGLWDIAAGLWRNVITAKGITEKQLPEAQMQLAESLVRSDACDEAINILLQEKFRKNPVANFWLAQALAGNGKYSEAAEILTDIATNPNFLFQAEAAFTASNLYLALGKNEDAYRCLTELEKSAKENLLTESKLRRSTMLLELEKIEDARAVLLAIDEMPAKLSQFAKLLEAQLLLAEKKAEPAKLLFEALLASPEGQTSVRYESAILGYTDCLAQLGNKSAAIESIFRFISENPDSYALDSLFKRVITWLPESISSVEDPIVSKLAEWLPQFIPSPGDLINTSSLSAVSALPNNSINLTEIEIYAIHAYAVSLYRINTAATKAAASKYIQRLYLLAPLHQLTPTSLMLMATWKLQEGDTTLAFQILDSLRNEENPPAIRGEAAFINAYNACVAGDHNLAVSLFNEATTLLEGENKNISAFNTAIARLQADPAAPSLSQSLLKSEFGELSAELELERALAASSPIEAISALNHFLANHSAHQSAPKARLTIAEAALSLSPPDPLIANLQLEIIQDLPERLPEELAQRIEVVRLRLLDLSGNKSATIALAKNLLEKLPNTPSALDATMILGKNLFQSENYHEARLVMEKYATSNPSSKDSQAALLIAARAASLGATTQSREEALAIYSKISAQESSLQSIAILEQARLLIDLDRLAQAIEFLTTAYSKLPSDHPSRIPVGLLLAEANYANAVEKPDNLTQAVNVYDELIKITPLKDPISMKLLYLRGLSLEKMPDSKQPSKTRIIDARESYYKVIDRPISDPPLEWEWFERSGFRLLSLLEIEKNWKAAISIAEKLARFKGPRSEEVAQRAQQLRLKHMVWDD